MLRPSPLCVIDLGTDKCVTLIGSQDPETNSLQVLGVAAVPSKGMRKSQIVDLEDVLETMTASVDAAERMAGLEVRSVTVSISGPHISSQNSKGVVAVAAPTQEITPDDVDRVLEAARAISLPSAREIIHVIPRDFAVDSQTGIKDPVGMTGVRLEAEAHIITGQSPALRNLAKIVQDLGLELDGFVFSGLAAAEVMLSETEKELGVVLVDIGAGSTSVCAYVEGALQYSGVLPIGARHITQDIALGCRMSLDGAEKLKIALANDPLIALKPRPGESKEEFRKRQKQEDELDLQKLGIYEQTEPLSKRTILEGIMVPRMKEMFSLVLAELQKNHLVAGVPAGLVLSGGGAETVGIVEVAKRTLNLPARVGKPTELRGLVDDIQKPSYATSIGLLIYAAKRSAARPVVASTPLSDYFKKIRFQDLGGQVVKLVKSFLP
ncbi:cell division protein FtsA [Patescibacteria group bacterium]|nr:cell division protein FtsA [Patescibacteria group bacterium]